MFFGYKKEINRINRITFWLTFILFVSFTVFMTLTSFIESVVLDMLISFIVGYTAIITVLINNNKRSLKPLNEALQDNITKLDQRKLSQELDEFETYISTNKKYEALFSITLFSGRRILGNFDETYLGETKKHIKKVKNDLIKANYTIELLYYYLSKNDVEMFMMGVNKLKSYHTATFEKLYRKLKKHSPESIINDREYKELALIGKIYRTGPDDEMIDKLLSTEIPYYKMLYTFYVMNLYKYFNDEENALRYETLLHTFKGNAWPLRGDEFDVYQKVI